MRAVLYEGGGYEHLFLADVPDPEPGPGQVLVRVRACAMNHLDVWATGPTQLPGGAPPSGPRILGADLAGDVVRLGPGVSAFQPGDRVLVHPLVTCGRCAECQNGRHNYCAKRALLGSPGLPGGYGELVCLPAENLYPVPANLSYEEAASIPLVFITAWEMLITKGHVQMGQWVLVNSAGSGVGIAAIQVAKLHGAKVITTASTEGKRQKGIDLGADAAVDYTAEGWGAEVRRLAGGQGVHLAADHVGGDILAESWTTLRAGGKLVTCGFTAGNRVSLNMAGRFLNTLETSFMGGLGHVHAFLPYFASGQLQPVIHAVYPFERAAEGHRAMLSRENFGKIVLTW